jgi:hypothetical protein
MSKFCKPDAYPHPDPYIFITINALYEKYLYSTDNDEKELIWELMCRISKIPIDCQLLDFISNFDFESYNILKKSVYEYQSLCLSLDEADSAHELFYKFQ